LTKIFIFLAKIDLKMSEKGLVSQVRTWINIYICCIVLFFQLSAHNGRQQKEWSGNWNLVELCKTKKTPLTFRSGICFCLLVVIMGVHVLRKKTDLVNWPLWSLGDKLFIFISTINCIDKYHLEAIKLSLTNHVFAQKRFFPLSTIWHYRCFWVEKSQLF